MVMKRRIHSNRKIDCKSTGVVQVHIDRLVLEEFPEIDGRQFSQSLQNELNQILEKHADQYQWGRLSSTTRIVTEKIDISPDSSSQELGGLVASKIGRDFLVLCVDTLIDAYAKDRR